MKRIGGLVLDPDKNLDSDVETEAREENKDIFSGNKTKFNLCKANKRQGYEAIGERELAYTCKYNPTTLKPPEASPKRVM